ncbi:MAG: two-component regulator propeller domain-containing protein [Maribacter dokdonensis]|uniref:ligand-binding sensor domain-containing protein n=1 Tax=Maribacter dokdonensis TaxID=320912 RepID=UPI003298BFFB
MIFNTFSKNLAFILLVLSSLNAYTQNLEPLKFHHIQDGMSQSSSTVLLEDKYGFIWVGTRNGLNKYDGKDFEIFTKSSDSKTGLSHEYIVELYEDDENLLIGTNQGLNVFNRSLNIVAPFPFKNEGLQIKDHSFQSVKRINGNLWLGTESSGVYKYDENTGILKHLPVNNNLNIANPRINRIIKIAQLDDNRVLIISSYNIIVTNNDLEILNEVQEIENIISTIVLDDNTLLLGTNNGSLIRLNVSLTSEIEKERKPVSPGFGIRSLAKNLNNDFWIGTENNGLYIYSNELEFKRHLEYNVSKPSSISGNSIWSLLCTRNGVMWVAPYKSGLNFYDPEYFKFKHINTDPFNSKSLSNKLVNCFIEDPKGNLWIGTDGGGLNYWKRTTDSFEHYSLKNKTLNSDVVLSILQNKEDELWLGTWTNGITIFNTKTKKFKKLNTENSFLNSNIIIDFLKDKRGHIWIINYFAGVQVFDPETNTHENIKLISDVDGAQVNSIYQIFEDKQGHIWIGTLNSGLFKLTKDENHWISAHYSTSNSLSNNFVNTVIQDSEGTIWVGTQGGLNKYNSESDSFKPITEIDGLRNDAIKGIIDDTYNHLWLSTENGITRYDTCSGNFLNYDVDEGLQAKEFIAGSTLTTSKGEYVFGGINGFNIFTAKEVEKRKDTLTLFVSGLKIFNKPVLPNDEFGVLKKNVSQVDTLIFSYDQSVINIDFKALTFRHPESVNYAFYLEGFEKEWNYVGNKPTATYTNLNPGNYTLKIKSTNSDGIWTANEINKTLIITPPYWQTWWFKLLMVFLLLMLFYVAHYIKLRTIKKNQRRLELKVAERTNELQCQKNKLVKAADHLETMNQEIQRFTFAVSHDLKSPLSNIKGLASLIPTEMPIEEHPLVEEYLNLIDVSCNNMNELISDITEIARLGKIENRNELLKTNEILNLSRDLIKSKLGKKNINLTIVNDLPPIYGDRNRIIQVFGNFLDNAVKYMGDQPNPKITVDYEEHDETNSFLVHDNGSGLSKTDLKKLFTPFERFHQNVEGTGLGLYMIKKIAISHGGSLTAESKGKGKGTTFKLILPKAKIAAKQAKKNLTS